MNLLFFAVRKAYQGGTASNYFEYNATSKKYFTLEDIQNILPPSYKFYRLRPNGDGRLDNNLNDTWNCVAVSSASEFAQICKDLIVN